VSKFKLTSSVLGDMLIHERDIRRKPPLDPESILTALRRVRGFQSRLKSILDSLPRVFRFLDEQENVYVPNHLYKLMIVRSRAGKRICEMSWMSSSSIRPRLNLRKMDIWF
jgi:hypothetical protein